MTKPVRERNQEPKESSKAWASWQAYRCMAPGQRGIDNLAAQFKEQKRRHQSDPEGTPPPPTTNPATLRLWSTQFHWQARLAVEQVEADEARRAEFKRQAEAQAREDFRLAREVGAGGLAVAAMCLHSYIDPQTGQVRRDILPKDLPPLIKSSIEALSFAHTGTLDDSDPNAGLHKVLHQADASTRDQVLAGLRALERWQEETAGRH